MQHAARLADGDVRLIEWLNFLATEVHKIYWPLFHDGAEVENGKAREKLGRSFAWVEKKLGDQPFLTGASFTVADAYLFTLLNWAKPAAIDLVHLPVTPPNPSNSLLAGGTNSNTNAAWIASNTSR